MKKITLLAILFVPIAILAQSGKVYDNLTMTSKILKMERKYAVYLPPDYDSDERRYPVLYLLHGAGDDQSGWIQLGEVKHITDNAIEEGTSTPMIIIMPDAQTGTRGYHNRPEDNWNYEDFFIEEFIPYIEKTYRIRTEKRYRAIAGLSMGGGGTFLYALNHPELFDMACPLSASTGPVSLEDVDNQFDRRGRENATQKEKEDYFNRRSILNKIQNNDIEAIKSVKWYIDCGDDDFLYEGNSLIHIAMRKREIPHEFRIRDGGHGWHYWRTSLVDVLSFISKRFHRY